jgi:hypothetical protein
MNDSAYEQLMERLARDDGPPSAIADLVLAAVRDAYRAAEDLQQQQMGPFAAAMQGGGLPGMPGGGGLNLPGGLDLSGLGLGGPNPQAPQPPHRQDPDEDKPET